VRVAAAMRQFAIVAAVVLCVCTIVKAQAAGSLSLAERSGFLLGVAHHCGVDNARIDLVGQRMMVVIAGSAVDTNAAEAASKRFAQFFVATSTAGDDRETTVRCDAVSAEFSRLERHTQRSPLHPKTP